MRTGAAPRARRPKIENRAGISQVISSLRMVSKSSHPVKKGKLLCVGHLRHDLVYLHRVAERAAAGLGLEPHFLITAPDSLQEEPREYLASRHLSEVVFPVADFSSLEIRNPVTRYRSLRQANVDLARRILDTVQPAAILATVDACLDQLLAEATRRRIPTVYMQVAFWGDRAFYRELWADDRRATAQPMTLRQHVTTRLKTLIQRRYGLQNRPAWWREVSRIAVLGRYWEDILVRGGISRDRIAVTGSPHCDDIHEVRSGHGRWAELYEQIGLPRGDRYFLHCREHHARLKGLPSDTSREGQRDVIEALRSVSPGTPIVVKMHPRDRPEDYEFIRSLDPSVIVAGDVPMIELLAKSLLMITTISTTQLWSTALDRPTISAFFWKGMDYWEKATDFSGVERVFTPDQLRASLFRYVRDPAYQKVWSDRRRAFVDEMLVVDGRSTERLVELLREPLHERPAQR